MKSYGPPQREAQHKILVYMHKVARPVYLGELALDLLVGLERVEEYVLDLVDQGVLRRATDAEKALREADHSAAMFALAGKPQLSIAYKP